MESENHTTNENEASQTEQQQSVMPEVPPAHMLMAVKMITELRQDLKNAFKRLATQHNVSESSIQLALRFKDLETLEGEMFYQLMVDWKPIREANFNRDFLGMEGKSALFPDSSGKEAFIKIYVLGFPQLKIRGVFEKIAEKFNIQRWSDVSGVFYKTGDSEPIKLGIWLASFDAEAGKKKNKRVELIDLFEEEKEKPKEAAPENEN